MSQDQGGVVNLLQEFSVPLLAGVAAALFAANLAPGWYADVLAWEPIEGVSLLGHALTLEFLVNDLFMVFFFGIAAKEITEACLPGGSLNPLRKAVNPLFATLGGVVGPAGVYAVGVWLLFQVGVYDASVDDGRLLLRGWGIPTATDIALAWLVARTVFGRGHPAIDFLLLLAVADDAVGLVIIAVFYGDPVHPARPEFLGLVAAAMGLAFAMRRAGVRPWSLYVALAGPLSWAGLVLAHLHPALALVVVVPFLPGPHRDVGLFSAEDEVDLLGEARAQDLHLRHSPLHAFEQQLKLFVDFGLFFFAFANAGVAFADVGPLTWLVLAALVLGKTIGITLFGLVAVSLGFPLPSRMNRRDLVLAGFVAALGLTVALFVATAAFQDGVLQGQAKMGALFSGFVGFVAIALGRVLRVRSDAPDPVAGAPGAGPPEGSS